MPPNPTLCRPHPRPLSHTALHPRGIRWLLGGYRAAVWGAFGLHTPGSHSLRESSHLGGTLPEGVSSPSCSQFPQGSALTLSSKPELLSFIQPLFMGHAPRAQRCPSVNSRERDRPRRRWRPAAVKFTCLHTRWRAAAAALLSGRGGDGEAGGTGDARGLGLTSFSLPSATGPGVQVRPEMDHSWLSRYMSSTAVSRIPTPAPAPAATVHGAGGPPSELVCSAPWRVSQWRLQLNKSICSREQSPSLQRTSRLVGHDGGRRLSVETIGGARDKAVF